VESYAICVYAEIHTRRKKISISSHEVIKVKIVRTEDFLLGAFTFSMCSRNNVFSCLKLSLLLSFHFFETFVLFLFFFHHFYMYTQL